MQNVRSVRKKLKEKNIIYIRTSIKYYEWLI